MGLVLELYMQCPGTGKSWNLLGNEVDAVMRMQMSKYVRK